MSKVVVGYAVVGMESNGSPAREQYATFAEAEVAFEGLVERSSYCWFHHRLVELRADRSEEVIRGGWVGQPVPDNRWGRP